MTYYHSETVIENDGYRVIAVSDDFTIDLPPILEDDSMLFIWDSRGWDGPWHECWEGHAEHAVDVKDVLRAANAFRDVDLLTRWLNIVSPTGTTYHVSKHTGPCQGDMYLYIVAFEDGHKPDEDFDPSESEPVCWARGDVYHLQAERYIDEYDMWEECDVDSTVVYGLDEYANTLATEMIAEAKSNDEEVERLVAENAKREAAELAERARVSDLRTKAETYDANAKDVSERFLDETNPTRRRFLLEEITYWVDKADATRNMI